MGGPVEDRLSLTPKECLNRYRECAEYLCKKGHQYFAGIACD